MKFHNIVLSLCLTFFKSLWFIITLHLYSYINTLQVKLSDKHDIETVDDIIRSYQQMNHKDKQ